MEINETEDSTENVLSRMENSLNALEQMSLDSINITCLLYTSDAADD